jgi:hypothetical protein
MLTSMAVVMTDAPARYAKQLLSHLGHKVTVEPLDGHPEPAGQLRFAYGVGTVLPLEDRLVLHASAENPEDLAHVEDVVGRHLMKFGAKRELVVSWGPPESSDEVDDAQQ